MKIKYGDVAVGETFLWNSTVLIKSNLPNQDCVALNGDFPGRTFVLGDDIVVQVTRTKKFSEILVGQHFTDEYENIWQKIEVVDGIVGKGTQRECNQIFNAVLVVQSETDFGPGTLTEIEQDFICELVIITIN